jgi:hypothetical protein
MDADAHGLNIPAVARRDGRRQRLGKIADLSANNRGSLSCARCGAASQAPLRLPGRDSSRPTCRKSGRAPRRVSNPRIYTVSEVSIRTDLLDPSFLWTGRSAISSSASLSLSALGRWKFGEDLSCCASRGLTADKLSFCPTPPSVLRQAIGNPGCAGIPMPADRPRVSNVCSVFSALARRQAAEDLDSYSVGPWRPSSPNRACGDPARSPPISGPSVTFPCEFEVNRG